MLIIKTKDRFSLYKYLITLLLVLLISGCGGSKVRKQLAMPIMPAEPVEVYWAGFAFLGDFNQSDTRYPYTAEIVGIDETGVRKSGSVIDINSASIFASDNTNTSAPT